MAPSEGTRSRSRADLENRHISMRLCGALSIPNSFPVAMDRSRPLVAPNLMLITISSSPLPIHVYLPLCLVFVCMMNITFDAS